MLTTIGFDADDTLWQNEAFFRLTQERFTGLLADHAAPGSSGHPAGSGRTAEPWTLRLRREGFHPFDDRNRDRGDRRPRSRPRHRRAHCRGSRDARASDRASAACPRNRHGTGRRLPGRPDHQGRPSGPGTQTGAVRPGRSFPRRSRSSADKTPSAYRIIFARHGTGADQAMMVGNSLKSDVIPALEAGSWGVHVPHGLTWALEAADPPEDHRRFHAIQDLGGLARAGRQPETRPQQLGPGGGLAPKILQADAASAASLQLHELSPSNPLEFLGFRNASPVLASPPRQNNGTGKPGQTGKGWATWYRFSGGFIAQFSWHLSSPLWW